MWMSPLSLLSVSPLYLSSGVGRVQPLFPQLLHVLVGETEQPLPTVPAGLGGPEDREVR